MSQLKQISVEKCPYCGGTELFEARVCSYGGAYISTGGFTYASLYATVCRDCGSVVRSYVKEPEKALKKSQRRI